MRFNQLLSPRPELVEALVYAAAMSVMTSNALLHILRQIRPRRVFPAQRMDAVLRDFATVILLMVRSERRDRPIDSLEVILSKAGDPNREQPGSHDVLEAILFAHEADRRAFEEVTP